MNMGGAVDSTSAGILQELSAIVPLEIYERNWASLGRGGLTTPLSTIARGHWAVCLEDRDRLQEGPRDKRFRWADLRGVLALAASITIVCCRGKPRLSNERHGAGPQDEVHAKALAEAFTADGLAVIVMAVSGDVRSWITRGRKYGEATIRVLDEAGAYSVLPIEYGVAA